MVQNGTGSVEQALLIAPTNKLPQLMQGQDLVILAKQVELYHQAGMSTDTITIARRAPGVAETQGDVDSATTLRDNLKT